MRWLEAALDLLSPPVCLHCGGPGREPLCAACRRTIPWPGAAGRIPELSDAHLAACHARAAYVGAVERWVRDFKYPGRGLLALDPGPERLLAALLAELSSTLDPRSAGTLVPIPLHPRRLRARGFNPAGLLARRLARTAGWPWV